MGVDRVSTLFTFNRTIGDFQRSQVELAELTRQISTGVVAEDFAGLGNRITQAIDYEFIIARTKAYQSENSLIVNRLKSSDLAVADTGKLASQLRDSLVQKRSGSIDAVNIGDIASKLMDSLKSTLNVTVEGRYIFSGSKTDIPPVGDTTVSNIINGVATDSYYQGDNVTLSAQASEQLTVNYGVRANDTAFKDLFAALHNAKAAQLSNKDEDLAAAIDSATKAIGSLAGLRTSIGNNMKLLQDTNSLHASSANFFEQAKAEITSTDIVEATAKVSTVQAILQASFQAYSKISNLRLSDYIN